LKDSKVQPAILSAGEVTKTLAAEMGFALRTASAIVIMEEPKIWDGVAEIVRFHAMEDLQPYAHCTAHATQKESVLACQASGLLIAA
jgi:hypothetical protein